MKVKQIIKAGEKIQDQEGSGPFLNVSEFFFDTIQGEGRYVGTPAAFLRLQGCPVNCKWCDTAAVWKQGSRVSVKWLLDKMEESGLKVKLSRRGYHLVVTGGSPVLQQDGLVALFDLMDQNWDFIPFIEVENECSIEPAEKFAKYISCWNNSPKLSNSGVPVERRYFPRVCMAVDFLAEKYGAECWWKFVVKDEEDIKEIYENFSNPYWTFNPGTVFLMPMGANQEEYFANREKVVELAIQHGFRYSPREHIAIWNQKTGI